MRQSARLVHLRCKFNPTEIVPPGYLEILSIVVVTLVPGVEVLIVSTMYACAGFGFVELLL